MSSFKIDELDSLIIKGELRNGRLVLPEIRNVKVMIISCCRIKNTYFDRIQNIEYIEVIEPYAIINGAYEYTQDYCLMLLTIKNIFDNIIRFGNITSQDYVMCADYGRIFDDGVLTPEKYDEFMSDMYGKVSIKSARK